MSTQKIDDHFDVIVIGGGPAGVGAAFAAARRGARTLIVEQFNCLGGVATAGGHGCICLYSAWFSEERVVGGIPYEMAERCASAGYGEVTASETRFEIEGMKLTLERMAEECGTNLLYHSFFSSIEMDGDKISSVIVQNKNGRQRFTAGIIIDATGDGDVAAQAGCGYDYGDEETGACQPMTLMFTIGGVDWQQFCEFRHNNFEPDDRFQMRTLWKKAQDNGDMRPFQKNVMGFLWTPTRPDQVGINFTHINHVSCLKAEDLTHATIEGRKQAYESIEVFRKYIPGMENCYMVSTPNTVGLRESRRIKGHYTLTRDDVVSERSFADSIGYGSFFIDIHGTQGPGMDKKMWRPKSGFRYQIPYRILLPRGVDNLLMAGRCASCDHEALGSLRVMPQCGVMGEAAGTAAAIALEGNINPDQVETDELQNCLREAGVIIGADDIISANT